MEEPQLTYRVPWTTGGIMLGIAAIADCLQVLLAITVALSFLGDIVTVIAEGIIWLFLTFSGVSFMRGKKSLGRMVGFLATTVIEMIPILDALPTLTFDTWYNIVSSRSEDRDTFKRAQARYAEQMAIQSAQDEELAHAYYQHLEAQEAADDNEDLDEYEEAA